MKKQFFVNAKRIVSSLLIVMAAAAIALAQTLAGHAEKPHAATPGVKTVLPSDETVNAFLLQMFGYDPGVTWKITEIRPSEVEGLAKVTVTVTGPQGSGVSELLVSADGKHAVAGEIIPFGPKPFEAAREKLEKGVNGPAKGPAKAAVLIVEFSDMQCPHCAKAAPMIADLLKQEPEARFVFQNYPLPGHNWAEKAAEYVDCVGRASNDAVWTFIQKTFDDQANITESNADEKLKAIATASGVKADEIGACAAKPETKARVEASAALGKSVGVNATPTLYINGRSVGGSAPTEILKKMVDFAATQAKGGGTATKSDK